MLKISRAIILCSFLALSSASAESDFFWSDTFIETPPDFAGVTGWRTSGEIDGPLSVTITSADGRARLANADVARENPVSLYRDVKQTAAAGQPSFVQIKVTEVSDSETMWKIGLADYICGNHPGYWTSVVPPSEASGSLPLNLYLFGSGYVEVEKIGLSTDLPEYGVAWVRSVSQDELSTPLKLDEVVTIQVRLPDGTKAPQLSFLRTSFNQFASFDIGSDAALKKVSPGLWEAKVTLASLPSRGDTESGSILTAAVEFTDDRGETVMAYGVSPWPVP